MKRGRSTLATGRNGGFGGVPAQPASAIVSQPSNKATLIFFMTCSQCPLPVDCSMNYIRWQYLRTGAGRWILPPQIFAIFRELKWIV
jgi:hypothetical protein